MSEIANNPFDQYAQEHEMAMRARDEVRILRYAGTYSRLGDMALFVAAESLLSTPNQSSYKHEYEVLPLRSGFMAAPARLAIAGQVDELMPAPFMNSTFYLSLMTPDSIGDDHVPHLLGRIRIANIPHDYSTRTKPTFDFIAPITDLAVRESRQQKERVTKYLQEAVSLAGINFYGWAAQYDRAFSSRVTV